MLASRGPVFRVRGECGPAGVRSTRKRFLMLGTFGRHVRQQYAGFLALFVALGGVSYAAITLPINSVGSKQIKRGAVKNSDLGKSAVTSVKVKNGSLLSTDFKPGQLVAGAPGSAGPQGPRPQARGEGSRWGDRRGPRPRLGQAAA